MPWSGLRGFTDGGQVTSLKGQSITLRHGQSTHPRELRAIWAWATCPRTG